MPNVMNLKSVLFCERFQYIQLVYATVTEGLVTR